MLFSEIRVPFGCAHASGNSQKHSVLLMIHKTRILVPSKVGPKTPIYGPENHVFRMGGVRP